MPTTYQVRLRFEDFAGILGAPVILVVKEDGALANPVFDDQAAECLDQFVAKWGLTDWNYFIRIS